MLHLKTISKLFAITLVFSFLSIGCFSQTSSINGDWTNNATWGGVTYPDFDMGSGDNVEIAVGDTVTLSGELKVRSNATLNIYGYLIVTNANGITFFNGCDVTIHSGGTLKCETGVTNNNASGITVNGSLICLGDYTAGTGSVMSGDGAIQVQGTLDVQGSADVMGVVNPGCDACNITEAAGIVDAGIYSEDFSTDNGAGYDNGWTAPTSSSWTMNIVGSPDVTGGGDFCKVNNNRLEWVDLNGGSSSRVDWYSEVISGNYTNITVGLSCFVQGAAYTASLKAYYSIDGGSWVNFGSESTTAYSGYSSTFEIEDLSCTSTFQIKIEGYNGNSSSAICYIDDIIVYGVPNTVLNLVYSPSSYCSSDSDPSPTLTYNAGAGTYSSTSGLVFADVASNTGSSTGVIDVSASSSGVYTITYTDTDASTVTFNVTIEPCQLLMTDSDFTGCDAVIKDNGGDSDYGSSRNDEIILTPLSGVAKIVFSAFSTESGYDYLYIYEDNGASWDLIGTYHGTSSPGTITSSGTLGKLKLKFTSDGSIQSDGFEATISCYEPPASLTASWTVGDGAFTACQSTASSVEEYTINASYLTGDLVATPPAGFEISLSSGSGYVSSPSTLTIPQANAEAGDIIYVRMASGSSSPTTANLSISGGGLASATTTSLSGVISAETYYVSTTGSDSNNGLTSGTAFATLQKAIDMIGASCSSTTINIAAGTYVEDGIEIPDGTTNVTIVGAGIGSTIFDGTDSDRWILMNNSGDSDNTSNTDNITISDLKVLEYTSSLPGGAVKIEENITNITFENVWFDDCHSTYTATTDGGGAIFAEDGVTLTINSCDFSNSSGEWGGAVQVFGESGNNCTLTISKSKFYGNNSFDNNGGAIQTDYTTTTITNSLFYENTADPNTSSDGDGGAVSFYYGTSTIFNCTFADNLATDDGGAVRVYGGSHTFTNCIFHNNNANGSYKNVTEQLGTLTLNYCINSGSTNGATENNSLGAINPAFTDDANDDYSLSSSSGAIDVGTSSGAPSDDINGTTRSGNPDLGCYENIPNVWTGAVSTAWTNTGNWSLGSIPTSSNEITIPDVANQPEISSDVTLVSLTIDSGADITISSNTLTITGTFDNNGTLYIDNATVNADGTFDATGGTIDFTDANGKLILSSSVISLGTLDAAMGTVEYDGATQTVVSDNYYNLEIDVSGNKTAAGAINVDGNLTTAATADCKLDMGSYALNVAGNITVGATDGLDLTDASSSLIFDGVSDQAFTHAGSSAGASSSTLSDEDYNSSSLGALSTVSGSSIYTANTSSCSDDQWAFVSAGSANVTCSSCGGNRVEIWYTSCAQAEYAYSEEFTPTTSSIDVSFNYAWDDGQYIGATSYYRIYLYNSTTGSNVATLVSLAEGDGDVTNGAYSATHSVTAGNSYRIRFYYVGNDDWGAAFDNVTITESVSAAGYDVNDLTINNSGGNIIFNNEISVDGTITFTSGDIDASSNNLVLTSNATVSGADDDSHVIGTIVKTIASDASHEFPLGNGSVLRKVNIDPNDATSRDWTVTYTNNEYSDISTTGLLTYVSDTCYWDISPTSTPVSTTVTLNWSSDIGINDGDLSNIKLAHYNGTDWELITTTTSGVPSAGSVSGNVTSFSPFTIGTSGATPLPVTLTKFEGFAYNEFDNKLEWTTKTEKNADYMEIQHSDDGIYFNIIGIEKLAGNSQSDLFYEFIDRSVSKQINYYRLKQFDYDGKFNYSKIISIDNRHSEAKVVKYMTNLIGQKVDENYKGVVVIYYEDGSSSKRIQ
jgi:hypothetical protein